MEVKPITPRQEQLLSLIANWTGPELPRVTVLAREMGLKSGEAGIRVLLKPLIQAGYVERPSNEPGLLRLPRATEAGRAYLGLVEPTPLVQHFGGKPQEHLLKYPIPCGEPQAAIAEPEYVCDWSEFFISYRRGDYLLTATGNSMVSPEGTPDSIHPGDRCQVRPDIPPANGEVVHAEYVLDDGTHECTLKQYFCDPHSGQVTLKAWNPVYPDIVRPNEQVIVHGVVLEVTRRLGTNYGK